ncbi:metallopeptidase TldD-related protein [Mycoplasmatota bacterium zrk1]
MISRIVSILKSVKNDGWLINDTLTESIELFFVKKDLDMNRGKKVHHINVTVYVDFLEDGTKYKGSSTTKISPTMSEEEIKDALEVASLAAGYVKNEYYDLVSPSNEELIYPSSNFSEGKMRDYIPGLVESVYKVDNFENGKVNSAEFFINKSNIRIMNSLGVDIAYTKYTGMIELITDWKEDIEEVELYQMINFSEYNSEDISRSVENMLNETKQRALAKPLPELKDVPVLLSKGAIKELFDYYKVRADAKPKYEGFFNYEIGANIQGDVKGDKVNITVLPNLINSTNSSPCDSNGFVLKEVEIIKDGLLNNYIGDKRYSNYVGVKPTGIIGNTKVAVGSTPESILKKDPYLELVAFSDFQVNPITGNFGGEIRLARYFDGESITPYYGGSITGNVTSIQEDMIFSKEDQQINNFLGPKYVKIKNFSLTPSE